MALKTNAFSMSTYTSSSTEISLQTGVSFPTISVAVLSRAQGLAITHTHTQGKRGEGEARELLSEAMFLGRAHAPIMDIKGTVSDHTVGWHSTVSKDVLCLNLTLPASFTDNA